MTGAQPRSSHLTNPYAHRSKRTSVTHGSIMSFCISSVLHLVACGGSSKMKCWPALSWLQHAKLAILRNVEPSSCISLSRHCCNEESIEHGAETINTLDLLCFSNLRNSTRVRPPVRSHCCCVMPSAHVRSKGHPALSPMFCAPGQIGVGRTVYSSPLCHKSDR